MKIIIINEQELRQILDDHLQEIKKISNSKPRRVLLRTKDVCAMLNVSTSSVQNLRQNGKLPYIQLEESSTIFYDAEDIEKLIREFKKNNNEE